MSSTGRGFSRVMLRDRFFSRCATAAVGGGGNHGSGERLETGYVMCILSTSDESLSNRSAFFCAIAAVPRLLLLPCLDCEVTVVVVTPPL